MKQIKPAPLPISPQRPPQLLPLPRKLPPNPSPRKLPPKLPPLLKQQSSPLPKQPPPPRRSPPEPAKEEFKLAAGLSEKYIDFDNLALEYNGHILRFGEATVQDFLDAGVELISDDLDSENPSEVEAQVKITDTYIATLYFNRFSGYSKPTGDYILNDCYVKLRDSFSFDVTWGPNYGDGMVHLNIPLVLTMEELIENSGEPVEISDGAASNVKVCDYRSHSLTSPDDSKFCSEISLTFINDNLAYFHIFAHERI